MLKNIPILNNIAILDLFKKKEVEDKKVKGFNEWIEAIKYFMILKNWEKSKKAINEIEEKEKKAYDELMRNIEEDDISTVNDREKKKQIRIYDKKILKLEDFRKKIWIQEREYKETIEKESFKFRFKKIKEEINILSKTNRNDAALNLLSNFLEENKDKSIVINFYNTQKKNIIKNMEKYRKKEEEKMEKNTKLEALKLIWNHKIDDENSINEKHIKKEKGDDFFSKIKKRFSFYKKVKKKINEKKLFDEINILIEEDNKDKMEMARSKLESIHKWMVRELSTTKMLWYDFYWKMLWKDKISWDTFGFLENKQKYNFFLWDATGHGMRAGFIVTLLSKLFDKYVERSSLRELAYEINNWLKQKLESRNFITGIFFEIKKEKIWEIKFAWMWHEPMLLYRASTWEVESIIPWWLAAWIREIRRIEDIKIKSISLEEGDILLSYSDWIVEIKNREWSFYWINRLQESFYKIIRTERNINKVYEEIVKNLKIYKWTNDFLDDATIVILKRNKSKDIIKMENNKYIEKLTLKEWLSRRQSNKLEGKTKEEIELELENIRKEKEIKAIIKNLEGLYYTWEILKLKQEAIRFIKKWYIDKKINYYLKKAMANETRYKIEQKNQKARNKFNILKELLKKWDYITVKRECENIIARDGNI